MASNSRSAAKITTSSPGQHARESIVMASLEPEDFLLARIDIDELATWDNFDDFACERDGLFIGLSCAGEDVSWSRVSARDYRQWRKHTGAKGSLASLDCFAAGLHAFRCNPQLAINALTAEAWKLQSCEFGPQQRGFSIPINVEYFDAWRNTLKLLDMFHPEPSIETYARLLLELWADID